MKHRIQKHLLTASACFCCLLLGWFSNRRPFPQASSKTASASLSVPFVPFAQQYCNMSAAESPTPAILLMDGRSGSSSTWQIMTTLTGQFNIDIEHCGESPDAVAEFFQKHPRAEDWLPQILCKQLHKYPSAGITGFQWKPGPVFQELGAGVQSTLEFLQQHPDIKVVRVTRNPLDWFASIYKHRLQNRNGKKSLSPHCMGINAKKCLEAHANAAHQMELPLEEMLQVIQDKLKGFESIDQQLEEYNVDFVSLTYENLYYAEEISIEWQKLFQHLEKGPTSATNTDIQAVMKHQPTSPSKHQEKFANYEEIRQVLVDHQLDYLLH